MNPRASKSDVKYLRFLSTKKGREEEKKFILEGWRPLADALASPFTIEAVYYVKFAEKNLKAIEAKLHKEKIPLRELNQGELEQVTATEQAQGVIAVIGQTETTIEQSCKNASLVVVMESVGDPGNVGTMIRSADWFRADAVVLADATVSLYNEKVIRATAGSLFHIPVVEGVSISGAIASLKSLGFAVWGTDSQGASIANQSYPKKLALIFSSEAHGISSDAKSACDAIVSIPRFGKAESLNVASACAALLSHLRLSQ